MVARCHRSALPAQHFLHSLVLPIGASLDQPGRAAARVMDDEVQTCRLHQQSSLLLNAAPVVHLSSGQSNASRKCALSSYKRSKSSKARFRRPDPETLSRIRAALVEAGVDFIDENGGGAGARLKLSRKDLRAISRWEGEGGTLEDI